MSLALNIPTLETERLVLRGFEECDFGFVTEIFGNAETARFIGGQMPAYQAWRVLAGILGHWALRGFGLFCVEEKSSGNSIGFCGPWRTEGWPDNEIGYGFLKSAQGKGYAFEAAKASLKFAYEQLGWSTAISLIDEKNPASQNLAKKLGAMNEQQNAVINDKPSDIWRHLPKDEFLARYS